MFWARCIREATVRRLFMQAVLNVFGTARCINDADLELLFDVGDYLVGAEIVVRGAGYGVSTESVARLERTADVLPARYPGKKPVLFLISQAPVPEDFARILRELEVRVRDAIGARERPERLRRELVELIEASTT